MHRGDIIKEGSRDLCTSIHIERIRGIPVHGLMLKENGRIACKAERKAATIGSSSRRMPRAGARGIENGLHGVRRSPFTRIPCGCVKFVGRSILSCSVQLRFMSSRERNHPSGVSRQSEKPPDGTAMTDSKSHLSGMLSFEGVNPVPEPAPSCQPAWTVIASARRILLRFIDLGMGRFSLARPFATLAGGHR